MSTRVDLVPTGLNAACFPAQPWLLSMNYIGGFSVTGEYVGSDGAGGRVAGGEGAKHVAGGAEKTVMVHELAYRVQGVSAQRWRRCFVVHTYLDAALKPILLVALPATSPVGSDGARDLFSTPPGSQGIQFDWPLAVVRDTGVFAVLIDRSRHGLNSYEPENAYDPIIDDVAGIDAARWFIDNLPVLRANPAAAGLRLPLMKNILIGGLSYGAISASFLAGAVKDVAAVYMAGAYPNKSAHGHSWPPNPPDFFPTDWISSNYDYPDMLRASHARKIMFAWGGNAEPPVGDYANFAPFHPDNLQTADDLRAFDPSRFDYAVVTPPVCQGHEVNLPHLRAWFSARVQDLVSGGAAFEVLDV